MNHRIILMGTALLMMFAVYGYIMMIGAIVGDNDAVFGNALMGSVFLVLAIVTFNIGMAQRRRAHERIEDVVDKEMREHGYIDAERFAEGAGVSLDDARDILDRLGRKNNWKRTELTGYNAEYRN